MKSKELIKQLQELDPEGEAEVCVGNEDIYFAERLPAYYDGKLEVLIRDETKRTYNITGIKITGRGDKIKLHTMSLEDVVWNHPEAIVDLSELSSHAQKEYQNAVDEIKEEERKFRNEQVMEDVLK